MTPLLMVTDACVSFGDKDVLKGISLQLAEDEVVAVMGRSGCGKTTLLRSICALIPLDRGSITLKDQKIVDAGGSTFEEWEIRRHVMYVAQSPTLLPHLTAFQNVSLGLQVVRSMTAAEASSVTREAAEELGLGSVLTRYPEQLSGGEAQRVQLLRAMILRPDILLLDEVTANIDPETTREVVDSLWLMRERGTHRRIKSMIFVTHIVDFAEKYADRILFMHDGVIREEGHARTFRERAQLEPTRRFLASNLGPLGSGASGC